MEAGKSKEEIDFIPGPEMIRLGKLDLPSPPEIQRGNFDHEVLVKFPRMSNFPRMKTVLPQLLPLDERNLTQRFSHSELAKALQLSEAELHMSILESGRKLRFRFFGRLDRFFHNKPKGTRRTTQRI